MSANVTKARILIGEDDPNLLDVLKSLFRSLGHRVKSAPGGDGLAAALAEERPDILVCGCRDWRSLPPAGRPHTIVTAAYDELQEGAAAVRDGADAMLTRPVRAQSAIDAVSAILPLLRRAGEDEPPSPAPDAGATPEPEPERHFGTLVGEHPAMLQLYDTIAKVAATGMSVLIRGESGVGKELVAHAIHAASPRAARPFVAINCAAVPATLLESELFGHVRGAFTGALRAKEGLFAAADGGTVFLDEIGSIPVPMQLTLLRVLQDHTIRPVGATAARAVDVRVVAATNENLERRIREGLFREDLFFRLAAFPLTVPPLRERASDIPALARLFLRQAAERQGVSLAFAPEALALLGRHAWPGNVRELQNVIARAAAVAHDGDRIAPADLLLPGADAAAPADEAPPEPPPGAATLTLKAYLRLCERAYIQRVLGDCGGDKERAAKALGISIGTLYRKLEP